MARTLRALREDAGLSQAEVAVVLGVSQQAVGKWEAANDPGEVWPRLAKVLGVKEHYPGAPFEPAARRAWFDRRVLVPTRGAYGTGVPPGSEKAA